MTLKEILIAGKLTVSEGGGGGAVDYESGEITISETTQELVIPVSALYSHFLMAIDMPWGEMPLPNTGNGGDTTFVRGDATAYTLQVRVGTAYTYSYDRTPSWRNDKITFADSSITLHLLGNGTFSEFPDSAKYRWVAW